jgi:hypothetical protein
MSEARRQGREVIDYFVQVLEHDTGHLLGYLVDVTEHGFMLQSHEPLEGDQEQTFRLVLREPLDGADHIEVTARRVWTREKDTAVFVHNGLQFTRLDDETRQRIRALMERHALEQAGAPAR